MSPVEFEKRLCRPVEFSGQGPHHCENHQPNTKGRNGALMLNVAGRGREGPTNHLSASRRVSQRTASVAKDAPLFDMINPPSPITDPSPRPVTISAALPLLKDRPRPVPGNGLPVSRVRMRREQTRRRSDDWCLVKVV